MTEFKKKREESEIRAGQGEEDKKINKKCVLSCGTEDRTGRDGTY